MDLSIIELVLLAAVGAFAAAINAAAGGGTFFTFPTLVFCGLPPTLANTTSTFGVWFGSLGSVGGYWNEIKSSRKDAFWFCIIATIGSLIGSVLLLVTPQDTFAGMVPYLMLGAVSLFALGRKALDWVEKKLPPSPKLSVAGKAGIGLMQLLVGIYGGFFGAGIGILMIAIFELTGIRDIHRINGMKVLIATCINFVSVATFVIAGAVIWAAGLSLVAGSIVGGYYGAVLTKRIPQLWIRRFIIIYGLLISLWFFVK